MVEKYFLNYAKSFSYEGFADIKFSKKIDILFVDTKFDDQQNFCVSLNPNNTCKDSLRWDKFSSIGASILLFKIAGDNYKNSQTLYQKLQENIQNLKNHFVIRIDDNPNISKSLEELLKVSEHISDIYYNALAVGLSGEIYFINDSGVVSNFIIKSIASNLRYSLENVVKEAKLFIDEFKNFLEKNNYKSLINPNDFDSFFGEQNQKIYLKNYFLSTEFNSISQINNPDNFSTVFFEILNYQKKLENSDNSVLESFVENCIFKDVVEKSTTNDIISFLKKIKTIAQNFDKVTSVVQNSFISSFQSSLEQIKSTNLIAFFVIHFFENIIFSESKKIFFDTLKKNNFLPNKGIEISHIFKKQAINYRVFFDAQSDYSFSETTANAFFSVVDRDIIKIILYSEVGGFNIINRIIKKKFLNEIIENATVFTVKALVKYVEDNFDDIEKNKFSDSVSRIIFTRSFVENNAEKLKSLFKLLPHNIQEILPNEYAPLKNKLKSKSNLFK